jgi:hypothetical protein
MLMLKYYVQAKPSHPQFYEVGTSIAHLFVNTDDADLAESVSEDYLAREHWQIDRLDRISRVKPRGSFHADKELTHYYDSAIRDGLCCVIAACEIGGDLKDEDIPK